MEKRLLLGLKGMAGYMGIEGDKPEESAYLKKLRKDPRFPAIRLGKGEGKNAYISHVTALEDFILLKIREAQPRDSVNLEGTLSRSEIRQRAFLEELGRLEARQWFEDSREAPEFLGDFTDKALKELTGRVPK